MLMIVATVTATTADGEAIARSLGIGAVEAVLLAALLMRALTQVRGTTLWAPGVWALISTASLALNSAAEFAVQNGESSVGLAALRFAAAASTLCPLMAVLGAKRPQNRGWQWIVATLWLVLVWPAGQALLTRTSLELFIAWKLFLLGLVALGLLNYLPTRFWLASLLVALGQVVTLGQFLWTVPKEILPWVQPLAGGCFLAAGVTLFWQCQRVSASAEEDTAGLTRCEIEWLRFRDSYGTFWGLRFLGRVNETAELLDWPIRLNWSGFAPLETKEKAEPTPAQLVELQQTMSTLLRRFLRQTTLQVVDRDPIDSESRITI